MKLDDAVQQPSGTPIQKAILNLMYTYHWFMEQTGEVFTQFDLTQQQYNVLRLLRSQYPNTIPVGVVKEMMMDKNPDLTRLCDRLCAKGLAERGTNAQNRRQVLVRITPAGMDLLKQIDPLVREKARGWARLSDEEAQQLSDLLEKLRS
ncbi:MAG: winged helix DNA-binding protein [Saprospiraceae bacterium]|jgi:DNA-binding MarR family transcriptional regulator|nr:winged helix DNA-binding protein [Saprospiraceae bacterium]